MPSARTVSEKTSSPSTSTVTRAAGSPARVSTAPTARAAEEPPGAPIVPYPSPAGPSFPAAATTSVPSVRAPATASCLGAVRERCVRLDDGGERDGRRVADVAVAVGVDGPLEPGQHRIGPSDDLVATAHPLPAEHADRQDRRAGSDAGRAFGSRRSGDDAGHPRAVSLDPPVRAPAGERAPVAVDQVDSGEHASSEGRMRGVDPGVEHGDRDSCAVGAGYRQAAGGGADRSRAAHRRRGERRRIDRANRVDAHHAGRALERDECSGAEHGREAVERAGIGMERRDLHPLGREDAQEAPLERLCPLDVRPLCLRGQPALLHPLGERRPGQDDDHPASGRKRAPPLERALPGLRRAPLLGGAGARKRADEHESDADDCHEGKGRRQAEITQTRRVHPTQDSRRAGVPA